MRKSSINLATNSGPTQKDTKKVTSLTITDAMPTNINITLTKADVVLSSINITLVNTEAVPTNANITPANTGVAMTNIDVVPPQKDIEIKLVEVLLEIRDNRNKFGTGTTMSLTNMYAAVANSFGLSTKARDMESKITNDNVFEKRLRFAVLSLKHRGILDPNGQRGTLEIMPQLSRDEIETLLDLDATTIHAAMMNKKIKDSGIQYQIK